MRKICFLFCILFTFTVYAQKDYTVKFGHSPSGNYQLTLTVDNWNLEEVTLNGSVYEKIIFSQSTVTTDKGYAEVPFVSASVQLPPQEDFDLKIVSAEYEDITIEHPLMPSLGTVYRDQDPSGLVYKIAAESLVNKFYPENTAYMEEPYIVRDVRGTSVRFFPFRWNAVTKTLRVYKNVIVELQKNMNVPTNPLTIENSKPVREAIGMYKSMFVNFNELKYDLEAADHGDILVITTARDEEAIEPYIKWKREKGFHVSKEIVNMGTNVKDLIQQKYNENNNLMYVLLVGDWSDIKAGFESFSTSSGPTDPMLGCVAGNDNYPDIAIGRFSANNPGHVMVQVDKTINYEKNPNMDPDWRETYIGIGSNEFLNGDDNERDFLHIQRIYSQRLEPFTYKTHKENYDPGADVNKLIEDVNAGASTIAYCGHGQNTYFVTTGYSNTQVNASTNGNKLPFIVAAACYTGAYHSADNCFGEAWLRKENGGAILAWMSSISQPWSPPQRGQDYFYDMLIGGFNYDNYNDQNGINTTEQRTHFGSLAVNTFNLMLTESSLSGDWETVKTWITFGDPSAQLRTKKPDVISTSNDVVISGTNFETIITANGAPVKDALVCISQNGVYAKGFTDALGKVSIEHSLDPGDALLVVTAFNTTTIYENILCVSPQGPHVVVEKVEVSDDNNQLDYSDEAVKLNLTLKNVGNNDAANVKVTISSDDPYVTITKATATFPSVSSNDKATLNDLFELEVDNNIPDQHEILFVATIEDSDTRTNEFHLTANAPSFVISDIHINDVKDGRVDGNEIAMVKLTISNHGHSDATNVKGRLSTESGYVNVSVPSLVDIGNLSQGDSKVFSFFTTVSEQIPAGHVADMHIFFTADHSISKAEHFPMSTQGYCTPGILNCEKGDKLTSFILGDIENTDESCNENGYSDYTHLQTALVHGEEYTVKAKCGYDNERVRGWIDYNGNGIFEEDESAFIISCAKSGMEATRTFVVPESAVPGTHRMRVRVRYGTNPDNPCENSWTDGQTHDYTIVIPERYPRVENLKVVRENDKVTVSWDAPNLQNKSLTLTGYNILRNNESLNTSAIQELSYPDTNVGAGTYAYKVIAVYNEGVSLPAMSDIVAINDYQVPSGLTAKNIDDTTVELTWNAPSGQNAGYNIYRNNKLVNESVVTGLSYRDNGLQANSSYCYVVTAIYSDSESGASQKVCVKTGTSIQDESVDNGFKVYPNPVNDELYLVGNTTPDRVRIYSITGRLMMDIKNCEKEMSIPVSSLAAGIYLLEIHNDNSVITNKIIKK